MKRNIYLESNIYFLLLIITSIIINGCNKKITEPVTPTPSVTYTDTVPLMNIPPIIFGFVNTESKLITLERWQHLGEYLMAKTGIPIEIKIFNNDTDLLNGFSQQTLDMAFVNGLLYVKAREKEEVIPVLRSIEDGSPFTKSYIIVRKDSNLKTIEDLKHRKISFTDKSSAVGYLFPRVMLAKKSITDINTYFSEVKFTGDDFSSFLAVYNGYVDGGIVSQSVMRKKDDRLKEMKIIGETEAIPLGTVIIRPGMEKEYINKLNKAFLQIGKTIDTRDLTKTIKIDGYVESTDSDYDGIRENIKILNKIEK